MAERRRLLQPERLPEDEQEVQLRPQRFSEFVGQRTVVQNLQVFVAAARQRGEALDHVLLTGPPGLGKTTLASIIAREMAVGFRSVAGPILERPGDLAGLLTTVPEGTVVLVDEIHRLPATVEEYLYAAMEDFRLDIVVDTGPAARSVQLRLPRFTLVGATTRQGLLSAPLRSRFGIIARLDYYSPEDLRMIVRRSAQILGIPVEDDGAWEIARRARGTPRIANRLLRRTRDFAQVKGDGVITAEIARTALEALEVDEFGLDEMDKRILLTIIEKFGGGPVGLNTISVAVGEEPDTIEEVYEPFLIQQGFLRRTPRGREATELAYRHLRAQGATVVQPRLFE
ncbi:MAG: Holliday junction branch migration DNA helicase RuvB [Candidatus Kapabacteria bacterium]|nr:Holliday junction branch migration DNA helicase RuvB [Candidatus Kapabacteria bacterium]MCS7169825.1 Holliday junction branch migration DNA helicase RuvB [Candidatus Kapabacteria bacterium]MDW7996725.1 Holliday junction branch migration DNA helicase RuvB [Bacteroidota bacterium]MDW8225800.1 Holliday junction branch migration DNA helicase RuvB [Bacteroidota bacterium]